MGTHGGAKLTAAFLDDSKERNGLMSIATQFSALLPKPRYERRPQISVHYRAKNTLSRDRRWKKRDRAASPLSMIGAMVVGLGLAAGGWEAYQIWDQPPAAPVLFPELVAKAEAIFPEALHGHTRVRGGALSDGRDVAVGVSLLLPAHALTSAAAAPDALTRLSAPFVGKERAISGAEMGERIAKLAQAALPEDVSRCYSYTTAPARRIEGEQGRTLFVTPFDVVFNPECG